jgi:hypothetical protein
MLDGIKKLALPNACQKVPSTVIDPPALLIGIGLHRLKS